MLIDPHGRRIRKLRLSLTDRCNLRCHYCMPVDASFMDPAHYLTPVELAEVVSELLGYGIEEIRLTGGEPLMRASFAEIAERLARLDIPKLSLTSNGIKLAKHFDLLLATGIRHLNISLDSLDRATFRSITHGDYLDVIVDAIREAVRRGFWVKVNVVTQEGINAHELFDFVEFSRELGIEVRFLELMRIGYACHDQRDRFVSAQTLIERLRSRYTLTAIAQPADSTSFNFRTDCGAQLGFIASESQPFCGNCSRWRLTAAGVLHACLLSETGLSLRGLSASERAAIYHQTLALKPYLRPVEVAHAMNQLGG